MSKKTNLEKQKKRKRLTTKSRRRAHKRNTKGLRKSWAGIPLATDLPFAPPFFPATPPPVSPPGFHFDARGIFHLILAMDAFGLINLSKARIVSQFGTRRREIRQPRIGPGRHHPLKLVQSSP